MVREQVRAFVVQTLLAGCEPDSLGDAESLMERGILDSVGVLDLVGFLETTWSISIADEELVRENLDSIDSLVGFIQRKVA